MRTEGWEKILTEHLDHARTISFAWGTNDCALWCADWVRKATGKDFAQTWQGRYSTEEELSALMHKRLYSCPADIASEHLRKISINFAQRGDIVLDPNGCLGICDGLMSVFLTAKGMTRLHTNRCIKAWKVE